MSGRFLLIFLFLLVSPNFAKYLRNWKRTSALGCHFGDCSMIVSALRDPRTVIWKPQRWNKAMAHLQAYQELFNDDNTAGTAFKRQSTKTKRRTVDYDLTPAEYPLFDV